MCFNTFGSHFCDCPDGFFKRESNSSEAGQSTIQCHDIDECSELGQSACDNSTAGCINTIGGYDCADMAVMSSERDGVSEQWFGVKPSNDKSFRSCMINDSRLSIDFLMREHSSVLYQIK